MSIHKSQDMMLNKAVIELDEIGFCHGLRLLLFEECARLHFVRRSYWNGSE